MNVETGRIATAAAVALLVTVAVTVLTGQPADGAFPGANGKIVTYQWMPANRSLITMNPDGTDQRGLMVAPELSQPRWSPDGQTIVYGRTTATSSAMFLEIRDADGSNPRRLTQPALTGDDRWPVWSPDGSQIVFSRKSYGDHALFVIGVDGTNLTQITAYGSSEMRPTSWSPDGSTILLEGRESEGARTGVFAISPDGSDGRRLTDPDQDAYGGDFAPDGTRIVYTTGPWGEHEELYTMRADGSQPTQLTHEDQGVLYPSWSPDGTQIVAQLVPADDDDPIHLGVFDAEDGQRLHTIVPDQGELAEPNWQPLAAGPAVGTPGAGASSTTSSSTTVAPLAPVTPPARPVATSPRLTG
jgi:Tol biopolymer transport system component